MKRLISMLICISVIGIVGLAFMKYGSIENAVNELVKCLTTIWYFIVDCGKHIFEYMTEVFTNLIT